MRWLLTGLVKLVILVGLVVLVALFDATPGKAQRTHANRRTTAIKPVKYVFFVSLIGNFFIWGAKLANFSPNSALSVAFFVTLQAKLIII